MSAKFTILGLFRTNVFSNKDYDVTASVYDVNNKILWHASHCILDLVVWSKFGNSSISLRQVVITTILWASDQKKDFLRDALGSSLIIWD